LEHRAITTQIRTQGGQEEVKVSLAKISSPSALPVTPGLERRLDAILDRALATQHGVVVSYVDRLRSRPGATPSTVIVGLERRYLAGVTAIGAASGGAAAVPGVGTAAALASGVAEVAAFVEATALFVLAVAEVHNIKVDDPELRRAVVLAVLLGETGSAVVETAGVAGSKWASVLSRGVNRDVIARVNKSLMTHLVARFGTRQGALALGRALPFGVGAGIGAAGNALLGRAAIRSARRGFPRPPAGFAAKVIDARWSEGGAARRISGELVADPDDHGRLGLQS
jgi:hypothetical protein